MEIKSKYPKTVQNPYKQINKNCVHSFCSSSIWQVSCAFAFFKFWIILCLVCCCLLHHCRALTACVSLEVKSSVYILSGPVANISVWLSSFSWLLKLTHSIVLTFSDSRTANNNSNNNKILQHPNLQTIFSYSDPNNLIKSTKIYCSQPTTVRTQLICQKYAATAIPLNERKYLAYFVSSAGGRFLFYACYFSLHSHIWAETEKLAKTFLFIDEKSLWTCS